MNYICQLITPRANSRFISKVTTPAGGLKGGDILVLDELDNTILGNYEVYLAKTPNAQNISSKFLALVVNDGFETLADGRRPDGNPNYYEYVNNAGETATVVFLGKHLKFNIGFDCISENTRNIAVVGNYLIPVANTTTLSASANVPNGISVALRILANHNTPVGGNYGGGFASSLICEPVFISAAAPAAAEVNDEPQGEQL